MANNYIDLPVEGGSGSGVSSLNSLTGALTLVAGSGISITPSGSNLTITNIGGGATYTFADSLVNNAGTVTLVNDSAAPGASKYYGTDGSGTLGYYALGGGSGTVTSVALADSTGLFNITGSPVTTSGTLTLSSFQSQTSKTFFAAPNGSSGAPTFRTIVASDVPTLNQNTTGTAVNITAASNSTLTTLSALSLPYSQVTGGPAAITALTGDVTAAGPGSVAATLATVNTNIGSFTNANITVNAKGLITAASNGSSGTGTVTSVALTAPSIFSVSGSPITTSGTITQTLATQSANTVFAGPTTGAAAQPSFRGLVSADIPNNAANTTGTASNVTSGTFTQGSVIFSNSSGQLDQDNAKFFWDNTNFTLGLGTSSPIAASILTGINTTGAVKPIQLIGYGVSSSTGIRGDFARGTSGSPTAAQSGDTLNFISGRGYGTSQFATASTGVLQIIAGETFTNTSNATYVAIKTTPTGSVTNAERVRVNSTGNVLVGTTTDDGSNLLQVAGNARLGPQSGSSAVSLEFSNTNNFTMAVTPAASFSWNLPATQGASSTYLTNDGSGNLSWSNPVVNIDGGNPASNYVAAQVINGGSP